MATIYGVPFSVHVRKPIVTAILKDIQYAVEPVIPFNPPPNWSSLSPTGLIPAMQDGGFTLAESTAICFYLERKKATPAILPADAGDCSRVLFFDGYAGYVFRSVIHGLFFQKIISPNILKGTTDHSVIDSILATTQPKAFAFLESQVRGAFLVGDSLTLADIAIVSNLINFQYLGFTIDKATYPKLAAYAAGIVALEPFQRALADEEPFAEQLGLSRGFLA
ncbi:MAG: glutathione S-transferase family protein [Rhodospirillales bacterium]|nr:glutathione S-transferase family protein [Rhodospirillales bacterium]